MMSLLGLLINHLFKCESYEIKCDTYQVTSLKELNTLMSILIASIFLLITAVCKRVFPIQSEDSWISTVKELKYLFWILI